MNKQELLLSQDRFDKFWIIMEDSFPPKERKLRESYIKQLDDKNFHINFMSGELSELAGFIAWWQLEKNIFIEHFAVSSKYRGKGLGKKYFSDFLNSANYSIVLEVEPPANQTAKRRIAFYEQLGLTLHAFPYFQPSYLNDNQKVEMSIMTSNPELTQNNFELLRIEIYKTVSIKQ